MLEVLRWLIRTVRGHRSPSVLLRNARWVAETRDIPKLWVEWVAPEADRPLRAQLSLVRPTQPE